MIRKPNLGKKPISKKPAVAAKEVPAKKKPAAAKAAPAKPAAGKAPAKKGAFGRPAGAAPARRAPAAGARRKPIKFVIKAPEGLRSAFLMMTFKTGKDHFIAPGATLEMIRGKWDNENAPAYDMFEHDPETATALVSRLMMMTYAPNPLRRFKANTNYEVLLRLGIASKDRSIRVGVKIVWRSSEKNADKMVEITDKKDPELRKLRRAGKFLAGAFTHCISMDELREIEKEQLREQREIEKEEARQAKIAEREAARAAKSQRAPAAAKAKAKRH